MRTLRGTLLAPDVPYIASAATLTAGAALWATTHGGAVSLGLLLGLLGFVLLVAAFVAVPHAAVAFTIGYFTLLPMLKTLVSPALGPTKDIMIGAAALAGVILFVLRKREGVALAGDVFTVGAASLFMALYLVDVGAGLSGVGRYGLEWFHGVRLVWEPLLLLLFALSVRNPRKTVRWAMVSVIVAAFGAAAYGLVQQVLGPGWLVGHGYSYGAQVRTTLGGRLRSFGTLDEPFDYATVLGFGLTAALLWGRRGVGMAAAGTVIAAGLAVSFVRGAAMTVLALIALLIARKGHVATAVFVLAATGVAAIAFLLAATRPTPGPVVQASPSIYLTLNGRTRSWREALGEPRNWAFGRGVGLYGTAAQRARRSAFAPAVVKGAPTHATDSGYLATLSDVGFIGLLVLFALFARILVLFRRAIAAGDRLGWVGTGLVTVMLLDAALRSSFTGFPTSDIVFLLIGLTLAATTVGPQTVSGRRKE